VPEIFLRTRARLLRLAFLFSRFLSFTLFRSCSIAATTRRVVEY